MGYAETKDKQMGYAAIPKIITNGSKICHQQVGVY